MGQKPVVARSHEVKCCFCLGPAKRTVHPCGCVRYSEVRHKETCTSMLFYEQTDCGQPGPLESHKPAAE